MRIAVIRETTPGERRVALIPESAQRLAKAGLEIAVEAGAGGPAGFLDEAYRAAGATLAGSAAEAVEGASILLKVRRPSSEEISLLRSGMVVIALLELAAHPDLAEDLARRGVTALALEQVPRTTRAQAMDVLSSMSTVAGYKGTLIAAAHLPRFFPMLMTAAGTVTPARVLIIGAGVAGLQAVATARRLGAKVEAFDPRPAAREQVESLGARFVGAELLSAAVETAQGYAREQTEEEKAKQREALKSAVADSDAIICSALVAGRKAPLVLDEVMVASMKPGSIVVDLAAEQGGNCALTEAGSEIVRHGVTIVGPVNIASSMASDASRMFSRNLASLLKHLVRDGSLIDPEGDDVARAFLAAHRGVVWAAGAPAAPAPA